MTIQQNVDGPVEVVDPVCGMTIAPGDAAGQASYNGQTYYFCSPGCLERFRSTPDAFVGSKVEEVAVSATTMRVDTPAPCILRSFVVSPVRARSAAWHSSLAPPVWKTVRIQNCRT